MNRLIPLVVAVFLSGCGDGDPVANDPMLELNVKRGNNEYSVDIAYLTRG